MEPQLIDYYNEMPSGINVIDKMNEELAVLQKKNDELEQKYTKYVNTHKKETFLMPKIRINTINVLKIYVKKIYNSVPVFKEIIYDFLNHEGWSLEYDGPVDFPWRWTIIKDMTLMTSTSRAMIFGSWNN